jgi:hypothetical protein
MVLMNASKKARYTSSITNQNQGGGPKKAGLVPTATMTEETFIAYNVNGLPRSNAFMNITVNPNVRVSRPVGSRPMVWHAASFGMNW